MTPRTYILFIALIILLVFLPSLRHDFAWDDEYLIIKNPYVQSWDYIGKIFTAQLYEGGEMKSNFYRPLQLLSFLIDYSIWKLNPFGYHLTSLLLHIVNSNLVYLIILAITASPSIAFITASLFGICPTISGVTYYISARSDLLMALFVFLSVLFFMKYRERKNLTFYIISIVLFGASLLCKEMAVMLPLLLLIEIFRGTEKNKNAFRLLLPYLIVLLIYIGIRMTVLNFGNQTLTLLDYNYTSTIPFWQRLVTDFKLIPLYLRILLLPYGLHMEWFIKPADTIFQKDILISIVSFVSIVLLIKKMSQKYNLLSGNSKNPPKHIYHEVSSLTKADNLVLYGMFWFLFALLPVLNIYPITVFFGEGWLYVPSVGFFIAIAIIFQYVITTKTGKIVSSILLAVFLVYYSLFTISYGKVWKDSLSIFQNVLKYENKSPFIYLTHNNMVVVHYNRKEFQKSIEHGEKSIALKPEYAESYNNLGIAYATVNRPVRAIKCLKKAIRLKKDYVGAYCNLGEVYHVAGLNDMALLVSKAALKIDPLSYKAYCNLGYIYSQKDMDKAIDFFKKASDIKKKSYEPHYCMGQLYMKNKDYKKALDEYEAAIKLGLKGDVDFYNGLALAYMKNNRFKEAEEVLLESTMLDEKRFEPHNSLGNLYCMFGYFDLAVEEYRKALDLTPDNTGILDNIRKTKMEWKESLKNKNRRPCLKAQVLK